MSRIEEERRRERIRRKRKRRLKRKIIKFCMKTFVLLVLVIGIWNLTVFLKGKGLLPGTKSYDMDAPVTRTEEEVRKKLEELAKEDKDFKEIIENYEKYPEVYRAALANNPEMLEYVLGYPDNNGKAKGELTKKEKKEKYPLLLQWDQRWGYFSYGESSVGISGCGPTCLSMVVIALTDKTSATPDKIAQYSEVQGYYVEGTGTSWSLMTEGAASFGITGTELYVSESVMKQELDAGHPIICAMREGDFTAAGHFIMIYGYDKNGFFVNDPNCIARSKKKWTFEEISGQIKNLWSYQ